MSNLTDEVKQSIESFGRLGFTIDELAIAFDLDIAQVRKEFADESGEIYMLYKKGRITAEVEIRETLLQSACNGSTPSLQRMVEIYKQADESNDI